MPQRHSDGFSSEWRCFLSADMDRRSGARLLKTIPETKSAKLQNRSNIHPRRTGSSFSSRASFVSFTTTLFGGYSLVDVLYIFIK